ncbi:MAG: DUF1489 domain-containing protein [Hyphomicrobiales bacterium]|nr:MAG: DUF1489 domain-containing protein [Hyphomicrobiales bacterium]
MALHLIKLCVGAESVEDLHDWIEDRRRLAEATGRPFEQIHTTRMMPKRREELLDGGSLYWVIKGAVQARQRILDIRSVTGEDGISRCQLVFEPTVQLTAIQPRRPFQGWRYLQEKDVPADILERPGDEAMPEDMRRDLSELGLL